MPPGYLNPLIKDWTKETLRDLKTSVSTMGAVDTRKLLKTLKSRHGVRDNSIWKTSFIFPLRGIMVEHGAGSGWKDGHRVGSGDGPDRVARPWFSDAMNPRFPVLADNMRSAIADYKQHEVAELELPGHKTGMNNYRVNISL